MDNRRALYRPEGTREYLIHLASGSIITAQPFMRVDTFEYRNKQLALKGLRWFVSPDQIRQYAKIPGGNISPNRNLWFAATNLIYSEEKRVFWNKSLRYFDGIGDLLILIKGKTATMTFDKTKFEKIETSNGYIHQLEWSSSETDVRFVLAWQHINDRIFAVEPVLK
jgi:hypothetical protein